MAVFGKQPAQVEVIAASRRPRPVGRVHWVEELQHAAGNRAVADAFGPGAASTVQRDTPAGPVPAYAQSGETCEPASLLTAFITWDREMADPANPNGNIVSVCDAALLYLASNRPKIVARFGAAGKDGEAEYGAVVATVQRINRDCNAGATTTTEASYQQLASVLSKVFDSVDATLRAVGARTTSTGYDTLAQIFGSPELKGLSPGQVAQIEWYVDTKAVQAGQTVPASGYHAFLIGRHATGTWYLSDQGNQPPLVLQASDLPDLRAALDAASASKRSWLDTRSTTQRRQLTWTGVRVFDKPESIDTRHRRILPPGQDLGMLDPPGWGRDIRMVTWDWVGTASSLGAARALFGSTGVGHGFVIAEMPAGMFNVAKTNPVATSAFEGEFAPSGLLVQSPGLGHCWLQLANADSSRRELLQVR